MGTIKINSPFSAARQLSFLVGIYMDWTMVNNAEDIGQRLETLFYLFTQRYKLNPKEAAEQLALEPQENLLCVQVISELRSELGAPSTSLTSGTLGNDSEVRQYLKQLLSIYDRCKSSP